ncbi:uncharacterized protein Ecym_5449 [Eremothecium cymbalariae DBVPG|uniref:Uncharacterized protein n=1 Tax=Eremothecium cymbalariae (strain CBS 270.75 / DBVPG 7215 / KCTC 17166 / NRRL Y-17582) TaxID=931890 RepID=I6NDQ7_ERECY|nr:hypothetical protein Ecym_5449 [Eremothecium cymbalariae DBVPG\
MQDCAGWAGAKFITVAVVVLNLMLGFTTPAQVTLGQNISVIQQRFDEVHNQLTETGSEVSELKVLYYCKAGSDDYDPLFGQSGADGGLHGYETLSFEIDGLNRTAMSYDIVHFDLVNDTLQWYYTEYSDKTTPLIGAGG